MGAFRHGFYHSISCVWRRIWLHNNLCRQIDAVSPFRTFSLVRYCGGMREVFFNNVSKLHEMPDSIVSDRDPKIDSKFWNTLMDICGMKLKMSPSRHPQTDGSSEIMNRMISNYLRCFCDFRQNDWVYLLPWAEFAYNSAVSEELGMSPFEMDIGLVPKSPLDMLPGVNTSIESVNELKTNLKLSLQDAQYSYSISRARHVANKTDRYRTPDFRVGDRV